MARLFGTDGVRGVAITELSCELVMNLGRAAATVIKKTDDKRLTIQIAKDTRISSDSLEAALIAGITSVGADVELLGVIPTPALAFLVKEYGANAGIMISASHNTVEYNGIKIFSSDGFKLTDEQEDKIEALLNKPECFDIKSGTQIGRVRTLYSGINDYISHIKNSIDGSLEGLNILIDSANGSASTTCIGIFDELSAKCDFICNEPNGININDNCGSTHIDRLCEKVKAGGYDAGLAFDGDADRCLAVDEQGNVVDGDKIMAVLAADMKNQGTLAKDTVVGTVMSNLGFHRYLKQHDINTVSAKVGDRYVLEEMLKNGYNLGGEQSGHIIFLQHATTGDGQLTAVQLLAVLKKSGKKLSELTGQIPQYPQLLVGVQADSHKKENWEKNPDVIDIIMQANNVLGADGRILVRASGTEPLIRIMIEGKDQNEIKEWAEKIAKVIEEKV